MVEQGYEGEMSVVVIEDENGAELYYEEDMVIEHDGKRFAILISLPPEEADAKPCGCGDADCEHDHGQDEPEVIIARIEEEDGEDVYVAPTDEEFDAVLAIYEDAE